MAVDTAVLAPGSVSNVSLPSTDVLRTMAVAPTHRGEGLAAGVAITVAPEGARPRSNLAALKSALAGTSAATALQALASAAAITQPVSLEPPVTLPISVDTADSVEGTSSALAISAHTPAAVPTTIPTPGIAQSLTLQPIATPASTSVSATPAASAPEPLAAAAPIMAVGYYEGDSSEDESDFEPTPSDDTKARSELFTAEQWDKMNTHLVTRAVTAQTEAGYQQSLKLWSQFLTSLPPAQRPGSLLLAVTSSMDKAIFVVLYSIYLFEGHELRDEALYAHLSSLRYHFEVNLQSTTFLCEGVIKRARKAAGFSTEEAKVALVRRALSAMLPFILSMANWVQQHNWDGLGWGDKADLDKRVVHLAIHLSLDCGNRVSNVTAPDGKKAEDHGIKAGSVVAIIQDSVDSTEQRIAGGGRPLRAPMLTQSQPAAGQCAGVHHPLPTGHRV
jgi:hypothetical protein